MFEVFEELKGKDMTLQLKQLDPELKQLDPELKALLEIRPPVRAKHFIIRRDHRKRLYELSLKSAGQKPQLVEPDEWQEEWIKFRLSHPSTWPKVHENKIGDWKHWR